MGTHHEEDQLRALLAPLQNLGPVTRRERNHRRSARRRLLVSGVLVGCLVAGGAGIAAGLGAFSGGDRTLAELQACKASTIALTTPTGAQVLTGHTDAGVYCITYLDAKGAGGSTAGDFGATPLGAVVALKALDTESNTYVIAGVVPAGYDKLSIGSQQVPITNQAFVIDPKVAASQGTISGAAGSAAVDLGALDSPSGAGR